MPENSNYYVECINPECGWEGQEAETVTFRHCAGTPLLMCPECREVVEYAEREV